MENFNFLFLLTKQYFIILQCAIQFIAVAEVGSTEDVISAIFNVISQILLQNPVLYYALEICKEVLKSYFCNLRVFFLFKIKILAALNEFQFCLDCFCVCKYT